MDGVPPFAIYDPGVDAGVNGSRRVDVRAVTIHTTEGNDSRGLGKTRHHDSPGTFNFLTRPDGALYCYYPADVRCSHAAGGNYAGPGIENEGFTGRPFPDAQLATLARLCRWLADAYGVPLTYKSGDPRIYLDQSGYSGFIAHRAIDYPPNRSYNHYDLITDDEWTRAIGGVAPEPPAPLPLPKSGDDMYALAENADDPGKHFFVTAAGVIDAPDQEAWNAAISKSNPPTLLGKVGGWVLRRWDEQLRDGARSEIKG